MNCFFICNRKQTQVFVWTPLDFIYVHDNGETISLIPWLQKNNLKQEHCGIVVLNHMRDVYSLFYDYNSDVDSEYYNYNENLCTCICILVLRTMQ